MTIYNHVYVCIDNDDNYLDVFDNFYLAHQAWTMTMGPVIPLENKRWEDGSISYEVFRNEPGREREAVGWIRSTAPKMAAVRLEPSSDHEPFIPGADS